MSRRTERTTQCNQADSRARLRDAEAFLAAAERVVDLGGDIVATNAIHSAIASADVLCCVRLGERAAGSDHRAAVRLLARVNNELATTLDRVLSIKTRAAYESGDVSQDDAERCVRAARRLLGAAREAVVAEG